MKSLEAWSSLLSLLLFFLVSLVIGRLVCGVLLRSLKWWAQHTETSEDSILVETLHGPSGIWVVLLGLHFTLKTSQLPATYIDSGSNFINALLILSVSFFLANLLARFVQLMTETLHSPFPITGLSQPSSRELCL